MIWIKCPQIFSTRTHKLSYTKNLQSSTCSAVQIYQDPLLNRRFFILVFGCMVFFVIVIFCVILLYVLWWRYQCRFNRNYKQPRGMSCIMSPNQINMAPLQSAICLRLYIIKFIYTYRQTDIQTYTHLNVNVE